MGMKSIKLRCATTFVALTALFSAPNVLQLGTLKQLTTPYIGYYRCETLRIGSHELLNGDDVRLQLGDDGQMTLTWENAFGKKKFMSFPYEYNQETGVLTLTIKEYGGEKRWDIPFNDGEIIISETLNGKAFFAKFSRK